MKPTTEGAFETVIETHLLQNGYTSVAKESFDRERAIFPEEVLAFIRETQPDQWDKLEALHGDKTGEQILTDLCKWMDINGSLATLAHGFKCYGRTLRVAFFKAAHELNPELEARYAANRLGLTRQLHYAPKSEKSLDVTLSLNGIPVATLELKNPLTRQTLQNAVRQYRRDRDPREPIFEFKRRALVHFAVDTEAVRMTTRLAGNATYFLPFDKGWEGGGGNPPDPAGRNYRTAYLWEAVLARDSLLDILARFIHLQIEEKRDDQGRKVKVEAMIFPRYHQLDAVRRLVSAARKEGVGNNYLVEHSAGSGKSNTIGWLAHRLASLHNIENRRVFDSVIVVTDRIVLDQQLQDMTYQFEHKYGVVQKAVFGRKGEPIHRYTMRQAIEEGFILDVLKHYTTYATYYRLLKACEDDPNVERKQAARALARFMRLHPHNIAQKTEVMVEHFQAVTRHKIGGRAKAMVVTGSRLEAVRYKQSFDRYIREKGYAIKTLVAFSGVVQDDKLPGVEYAEEKRNLGIREKELPEKFATQEYQVLLVAEKYQTGFDQPLLHTMYVDKRLAGIQAVQTLSRLNRIHPLKEDTFVLDFVNDRDEIREAFKTYYEGAEMGEEVDPARMYVIKGELDASGIYLHEEVERFCAVYFKPKQRQSPADHQAMNAALDPAVSRFTVLQKDEEAEAEVWRGKVQAFRNLYSFLSQIIPYQDSDLERLYVFLRHLSAKLPRRRGGPAYQFDDDVRLEYYRLQKISEGSISLSDGKGRALDGPTEVGSGLAREEKVPLSQLIDIVNQRFGTDFNQADQLFFDQIVEAAVTDDGLRQAAAVNPEDRYQTCLPFVPLKAAAGAFSNPQHIEDSGFEWVAIKSRHRLRPGMFVAQVVGRAMEPAIPDSAYCIFRAPVEGTRQGKTVLVQMRDAMDPETGERYTVKRYESEKVQDGDSWRHARIILKPVNPDFEPIVLTGAEEGELQLIAEFVEVLFHEALQPDNPTEKATDGHFGLDR